MTTPAQAPAGSQTLSRGLRVLEVLAQADGPLGIPELCERLELHRSIVYRLLRTLEDHSLVVRDASGLVRLAVGLAVLARSVEQDLRAAVTPELSELANAWGMTAFLTVLNDDAVVTLASVEPRHTPGAVAQRPGSRHSLDLGGPGRAIRALMRARDAKEGRTGEVPVADGSETSGPVDLIQAIDGLVATSRNDVIPGVSSVAVPLDLVDQPPAALALLYVGEREDQAAMGKDLAAAAARLVAERR